MKFWRNNEKKADANPALTKIDALNNLQLCVDYFERHIETNILFRAEFEVSKAVHSILTDKKILTGDDVVNILVLVNDIDKIEHYDGSGWYDYQIRLGYFLRISGFETKIEDRKMRLTVCL